MTDNSASEAPNAPNAPTAPAQDARLALLRFHLDGLTNELNSALAGQPLTPMNVTIMALRLMTVVEAIPTLTGEEKQKLVMDCIERHFLESPSADSQLIMSMLPNFIHTAVSLDNGEIRIHIDTRKCCPWLGGSKKKSSKKSSKKRGKK